ncbi:Uu.00g049770.m01.CDS01 [Anthostomella pinea]|uniref:Uu.00g049770.m01.CDS01 n=1 Tax=Anthostomella pinea TaxID=933095 RepID=A0AAI8YCF0_9PEZI|nr:Uu.00g049770.m01.CDS01 [Anthostomella pinea]
MIQRTHQLPHLGGQFARWKVDQAIAVSNLLEHCARIVLKRLTGFHEIFNVVAALIGALSLAALAFDEFHPTSSDSLLAAEGLLASCGLTLVTAVMVATMLLFKYRDFEEPTRLDLAVAWTPLVLLDLSIVELILGLVIWYGSKNGGWRMGVIVAQLFVFLTLAVAMAVWMWNTMSTPGGLGAHEGAPTTSPTAGHQQPDKPSAP